MILRALVISAYAVLIGWFIAWALSRDEDD